MSHPHVDSADAFATRIGDTWIISAGRAYLRDDPVQRWSSSSINRDTGEIIARHHINEHRDYQPKTNTDT